MMIENLSLQVDLVEPVEQLLNSARDNLHYDFDGSGLKTVNYYHNALQVSTLIPR